MLSRNVLMEACVHLNFQVPIMTGKGNYGKNSDSLSHGLNIAIFMVVLRSAKNAAISPCSAF